MNSELFGFSDSGQWQQQLPHNLKLASLHAHLRSGWLFLHAASTGCMLPHLQSGFFLLY
jgi:hypothetical protein